LLYWDASFPENSFSEMVLISSGDVIVKLSTRIMRLNFYVAFCRYKLHDQSWNCRFYIESVRSRLEVELELSWLDSLFFLLLLVFHIKSESGYFSFIHTIFSLLVKWALLGFLFPRWWFHQRQCYQADMKQYLIYWK